MRIFVSSVLLVTAACVPLSVTAQNGAPAPLPGSASGKPANLCQELVAFVRLPEPAKKADPQPAQLATAVQAPKADSPESRPSAQGTPQQTSGLSGQITSSGPGAAGPQGSTQNAAAPSRATANVAPAAPIPQAGQAQAAATSPVASAAPVASKPTPEAVEQVEAAARGNDLGACRSAAQQMRRDGVGMPAPLLALSAMNLKLLEAAAQP